MRYRGSQPDATFPEQELPVVSLGSLWLPVLLSAVAVFIASSVVWMLLPHHRGDFDGLPDEDAVRDALASPDLTPGQYHVPYAPDRETYRSEEVQRKLGEGPVARITVMDGPPDMGRQFVAWFLYSILVGVLAAYVAGQTLAPGAAYLDVFQVTGTVAWAAYGVAYVGDAIWFGRPWGFCLKMLVDGLVYGLLTAGVFGWLWPA